jgi:hypothetical protein
MAGRGPAPKDPSRRARRNADPVATTLLRFEAAEQPELPEDMEWPAATRRWWRMWGESPQAEHFGSTDWDFLLDTALIHAATWSGSTTAATELRLRVAKFGATPEDRARLRMQFAQADEADSKRPGGKPARESYADLRVLPSASGE